MSTLSHSPAPWVPNGVSIDDANGVPVTLLHRNPRTAPNRALITAAPDLLAACMLMSDCHGKTEWAMKQVSTMEQDAIKAIWAAIAKATK